MSRFDKKLFLAVALLSALQCGTCVDEAVFRKIKEKYLRKSAFKTLKTKNALDCGNYCSRDQYCASVNYKISGKDQGLCELNSERIKEADSGSNNAEFNYLEIVKRKCNDKSEFFSEETRKCVLFARCKDLLDKDRSLSNGSYTLSINNSPNKYQVYCHMTEIPSCGPGGWTLVMKLDGNKDDFNYNSSYWTNKETYAVEDGLEGLTEKQTKLASYWITPFDKICLGMKVNGVTKWIVINRQASSLFDVVAGGTSTRTTVGKDTWKSLIAGSSLQNNCNNEGFNIKGEARDLYTKVRLGLIANNEHTCDTCDSYIGFGASFNGCGFSLGPTCGNFAVCNDVSHYNTNTKLPAFGFILVQ